jgi:hypothetical protein
MIRTGRKPVLTQDRAMISLLFPLGIEKGKDFKPDAATQRILAQSARAAHAWLMNGLLTYSTPFWPDSRQRRAPGRGQGEPISNAGRHLHLRFSAEAG